MGHIRPPQSAKLVTGLLTGDPPLLDTAHDVLEHAFGPVDLVSPLWPFTATDYYRNELGDQVVRRFLSFAELIDVEQLPGIKERTNEIEQRLCDQCDQPANCRPINIDPGYMTLSKFVLATTKDYSHRLHIGGGIYGEVTLRYHRRRWEPWPWTYADYAAQTYHSFLEEVRALLKRQLAGAGAETGRGDSDLP
jgi:hypothetical protein